MPTGHDKWTERWEQLESRFHELSATEGSIYIPNLRPTQKVKAVFVGMEPSKGPWARTAERAIDRLENGFKNFMWSTRDFVVLHTVQQCVGSYGRDFYFTDLSKGAMYVKQASSSRPERYRSWSGALQQEIELVTSPETRIVGIGRAASDFLAAQSFMGQLQVGYLMHYSSVASRHHLRYAQSHKEKFRHFSDSFHVASILETANDMLRLGHVSDNLRNEINARLANASMGESIQALAFMYRQELTRLFGGLPTGGDADTLDSEME